MVLLAALLGFWIRRVELRAVKRANQSDALLVRLEALERQLLVMSTQLSPMWAGVQARISADLTHPHPQFAEMDELLRKLEALTITEADRRRLRELLVERAASNDPAVSQEERESAQLMIGVMAKVRQEAKAI